LTIQERQIRLKMPFSFKGSAKVQVDGVSAIVASKDFVKKAVFKSFFS